MPKEWKQEGPERGFVKEEQKSSMTKEEGRGEELKKHSLNENV